ncbi:MAG: ATP-dependent RNA helicase RhlE [Candidatus Azotimanducaceae bacterium]
MTFEDLNLNTPLRNALSDIGISTPTTIQAKAFSVIMSGRDVIGIAQTGTGKTYAYLLPLLRLWTFSKKHDPTIVIVVPTRELVVQVVEEVEKLTKYMQIRTVGVYGGTNINTQKEAIHQGLDVLVATPGRMVDLALSGVLRLKQVQKLVIDEVDEMLNLGFRTQLINLLDLLPERRQNLMFSATMIPDVEGLMQTFFNRPQKIEAAPSGTPLENISQGVYAVPNFHTKLNLLQHLLENNEDMSKVLVFTASRKLADLVHEKMDEMMPETFGVMHSNKSQNYRFRVLEEFTSGQLRALIATDMVSRGLDISDVSHVINFDMPEDAPNYMHRIGRTGRADKMGQALAFVNDNQEKELEQIESLMGQKVPPLAFPEEVEISSELIDAEKEILVGVEIERQIVKIAPIATGAFHEKKDKNKKVNLGGSYKRIIEAKYKKPKTRGQKHKGQ